jgi:hypothetical protein
MRPAAFWFTMATSSPQKHLVHEKTLHHPDRQDRARRRCGSVTICITPWVFWRGCQLGGYQALAHFAALMPKTLGKR